MTNPTPGSPGKPGGMSSKNLNLLKKLSLLCFLGSAAALLLWSQDQSAIKARIQYADDVFRLNQIQLRMSLTGQRPSAADQAWMRDFIQRRGKLNAEYLRTHKPQESIGVKALTDLGTGTYKGEQGGLYPDGKNVPPEHHLNAGIAIARSIVPLNTAGKPDPNGKIVFASIGYSNWTHEFSMFVEHAIPDRQRKPSVFVSDCAVNAQSSEVSSHADAEYYKVVDRRLHYFGLTPAQVQIIMIKVATQAPVLPFPWEPKFLQQLLVQNVHVLKDRFPNLKMIYFVSRIYAGYAKSALNPEPHAFETAFAVKWLIADQIEGKPELNYDAAKGPVRAPWLAWGPYLWADGMDARSDGLQWDITDLRQDDRTHPSYQGRVKVARLIDGFLKSDPTAKIWYTGQ